MQMMKREDVLGFVDGVIDESRLADSFEDLKLFCEVEEIFVKPKHIKEYLANKAKEDGVDLTEPIEKMNPIDLCKTDENLIKRSSEKLAKQIQSDKYKFNETVLQYYNDLFRIYTAKCLKICYILEMLAGETVLDKEIIDDLDLTVTNQKVLISDIERLIVPLKKNFALALDTKYNAENLETYSVKTIDISGIGKDGVHYFECLPNEDLQDYFGVALDKSQYVALTPKQQKEIEDHTVESFKVYIDESIDD